MSNTDRIVITIDGLAATGKSSLAKGIAQRLGFIHLNTGLLYRALAQCLIENSFEVSEHFIESEFLPSLHLSLQRCPDGEPCVVVDGNVSGRNIAYSFVADQLQSEKTSAIASQIAIMPSVRTFLLPVQRNAFSRLPIVAEGRDTGTVVFPDARLKIFVEVPIARKAERRFLQLHPQKSDIPKEEREKRIKQIEIDILERDKRDQMRAQAPCIPAKDAKIYHNTAESLTQAIDDLYDLVSSSEGVLIKQ